MECQLTSWTVDLGIDVWDFNDSLKAHWKEDWNFLTPSEKFSTPMYIIKYQTHDWKVQAFQTLQNSMSWRIFRPPPSSNNHLGHPYVYFLISEIPLTKTSTKSSLDINMTFSHYQVILQSLKLNPFFCRVGFWFLPPASTLPSGRLQRADCGHSQQGTLSLHFSTSDVVSLSCCLLF